PPIAKFVDTLPGLNLSGTIGVNNLGQTLPIAVPDTTTYPGSDYYIIALEQYEEKMHSELNPTLLRGYVQLDESGNWKNGVKPHYLGPIIIADRDRPVRLKFINRLPTGSDGNLFIPVDTTVMGAGSGPAFSDGQPCDNTPIVNSCAKYTENRADIHLHGGRTPWISDGTPHQWIVPAAEYANTPFRRGASVQNVPDMPDPGPGANTYYFTNQQSARLMFYHDHAFGITRLNVYAGEAAGYVITDDFEKALVADGKIPPLENTIPLILQDKTFVDASMTTKYIYNPDTGLFDTPIQVHKVRETDPLWNWGGDNSREVVNGVRTPVTGDLWLPHVYMPAQTSTAGTGGVNPFGRWMYGPWFYPATDVDQGPVANPYYDPNCSSDNPFVLAECQTPGQPELIPGTPNVSMGMEAFQDSAVVNGTVFPTLTVDPRAYRFRILNAASDRFFNLSFYEGDATHVSPAPALNDPNFVADERGFLRSNKTEVKMLRASAEIAAQNGWPADWPVDGRDGGVPDPAFAGPSFLQIASEGGFLPKPVVIPPQPITYINDPTAFWVGNVDKMGLAVGPAERADVIVDFSAYAGKTLILYNDAPAAWPARVPGYDYYTDVNTTGSNDLRDSGGYGTGGTFDQETGTWVGGSGIMPGYAPNTRTVMQVIVRQNDTAETPYVFDQGVLEAEFTTPAPSGPYAGTTLFERAQEPIIVGQPAYAQTYPNSYFPLNFPWEGINQINDHFLQFVTLAGEKVKVTTEPKGIHDEMGASFDPVYGRMSGNLGMQRPNPTTLNANFFLYGFSDIPTETVNNSTELSVQVLPNADINLPGTVKDGTQIWKISHNGVDTHPIHFHIFDVQLINRVGWDGQIAYPEPNELGWKDTVKISPLEDTIVAVRPRAPALPFGIPNSLRPLNPAIPIDSTMGFNNVDWTTGAARTPAVTNIMYDFGWEYVWHCHILSHEEMDMMRPIVLNYTADLPPAFTASQAIDGGNVVLNWIDPTPVSTIPADPETYRNASNEIGYNIYRTTSGEFQVDAFGQVLPLNQEKLEANSTSYTDYGATGMETYIVEAFNAKGSTLAFIGNPFSVTVNATGAPFLSPGPVNLEAVIAGIPTGVTISQVSFYDGVTLIGTSGSAPYTMEWNSASSGLHRITATVSINIPGGVILSSQLFVTVDGTLAANFTPNNGATFNVCDTIPFDSSSSTGAITGYSWLINGINYNTSSVNTTLHAGTYPVTLGIVNGAESSQVTNNIIVNNHAPTANTGGPYTVGPGGTLTLNGTGTDADGCDLLTYAWDLDNKNGYEYSIANPTISYKALLAVLGAGTHTINFKVMDSNGGVGTASTNCTLDPTAVVNLYTVSTNDDAGATVSFSPAFRANISQDSTTTFTVTPAISQNITSVSGAAGCVGGVWAGNAAGGIFTTANVTANCTVNAETALKTFTITANPGANGTISPATGAVNYGTSQQYTVEPAANYHITS
ncbi:MAG: multicopper oxidase domain-containing protein, partial [Desulfuromonadaceae bacterium]|nr:multicopper oxidase domain-containing protein [Desulfuromonadaceae bacterium]